MYLARPVQMGQHNLARNTSKSRSPPPPPAAPPPPKLPLNLKLKSKPAPQLVTVKPIFDRDRLLDEVRCGVQLRHTLTNDKSAPTGAGRVRSGGYSPPPDSVASTSAYSSRPDAKKPVFYGKNIENTDVPPVPLAPPPPKAPPPAALLKCSGCTNFDRDKLLNEIHGGVQLRKTLTNDRSAPIGVGIVRNDLSRTASPVPETFLSNSTTHPDAIPVPPPPVPPSLSPDFLSSQVQQNRVAKPITNPSLLKLGGKKPIDRDALLASIRSGVKLRKVEKNDRSSPFPASRDTSPDRHTPFEPVMAPPPPPLLVPPPPPIPSAEPLRRSRSPKPALMKLGGKVTVGRDELLRSIRQGVRLRKTVTNDKSSAIINDDDSGVRSPGRSSSTSMSNYEDDVYGSQSLSDLSSIDTSRFSSLSNIPPERSNDLFFASPVIPETGAGVGATSNSSHSSSSRKSPLSLVPMINVSIEVENYDDDDVDEEYESETVTLQLPIKQKADECYSSPIPTRKQIQAEIPAGSARDRIKMFGATEREASHSPVRSLSRSRKLDGEVHNSEFSISRMKKLFGDTGVEQSPASASAKHTKEQEQAATAGSESSIRRMVRKFSTDDDSNKASQPIWCQKEEKITEERKKMPVGKQKASGTKDSIRKKSSMKGSKLRRKSSAKNEQQRVMTRKTHAAPTKNEEVLSNLSHEIEDEAEGQNSHLIRAVPKVDISKFKERFENPPETCLTTEETVKPGRIKKPPWIKDDESERPPVLSIVCEVDEVPRNSWKNTAEPDEVRKSLGKTAMKPAHKQNSSDHEESAKPLQASTSAKSSSTVTTKKVASGFKKNDKVSPASSSSLTSKKDMVNVPIVEEETTVPTREGVGPYRYTRKISAADKKPAAKKNSTSSKDTSTSGGGDLLNSVSKPFGTNLSTTGQTTTIGADDTKGKSNVAPTSRHFVWKNKVPSKVATDRECDEAFGDKTTTSVNAKTATKKIDGLYHATPIDNTSWNHSDSSHSMSISSSSSSCFENGNLYGSLKQNNTYYLSSTATRCKYPDNRRKHHQYLQQQQQSPQQQLFMTPRECNGVLGRAHRVVVGIGGSHSRMMTISKSFQQRSLDDYVPIVHQQQQQQQREQQQEEHQFFHQNYRFQIDLENDQQPLRIVHR